MGSFGFKFFEFTYHFVLDLFLFSGQVLYSLIQYLNVYLQLLLDLDVISHFCLVLLQLLLVFNRCKVDGHDGALRHLVHIAFFGSVVKIVAFS